MKKRTEGVLEIIDEVEVTTTAGKVQVVDTENAVPWTLMKIHPLPAWVIVSDQLYTLSFVMLAVLLLKWVEVWKSNNCDLWHPSTTVARKLKKKEKQKKRKAYEPKLTEDGMFSVCNQRWAIWNAGIFSNPTCAPQKWWTPPRSRDFPPVLTTFLKTLKTWTWHR